MRGTCLGASYVLQVNGTGHQRPHIGIPTYAQHAVSWCIIIMMIIIIIIINA